MSEDLAIDIDGGHLFRYPSEVDPRKKATKVSYTTLVPLPYLVQSRAIQI